MGITSISNQYKTEEFVFQKATIADAKEIHQMMTEVADALEDKSIYVCDDYAFVKAHLKEQGFGVVAYTKDGKMVASLLLHFPGHKDDNLGRDLDLPESELDKVVHMETVVVLPAYRGNHLQEKLLAYAESVIDNRKYHYYLATVSPNNPASYKAFEKRGYTLMTTKEKYGGLVRRIYMKDTNV